MGEPEAIEIEQGRIASYSDIVSILYSEYTFNFEFSQQMPPENEKQVNPICLGRIVMSPQHAKFFSKLLSDVITGYEKKFGTISQK